jgi:hypothetical protein
MFFKNDDDEYGDWNQIELPDDCIRFGWHKRDGGLCKIEAQFDGSWGELNIFGMEDEMRNKAQIAIDAVMKGRMKCAPTWFKSFVSPTKSSA